MGKHVFSTQEALASIPSAHTHTQKAVDASHLAGEVEQVQQAKRPTGGPGLVQGRVVYTPRQAVGGRAREMAEQRWLDRVQEDGMGIG